jgi:hypothetical protein
LSTNHLVVREALKESLRILASDDPLVRLREENYNQRGIVTKDEIRFKVMESLGDMDITDVGIVKNQHEQNNNSDALKVMLEKLAEE